VLSAVVLVLVLLAAACQTTTVLPQTEETADEPTVQARDREAADMSTPSEVFEIARQSVVFVGTPEEGRGSGVTIDGGWVVTNAHVVGRARTVRVVNSDGVELGEIPIHAVDPVLDVAVLGPLGDIENAPAPIELGESADVLVGETVYLLGYPDETNTVPIPTLTEGIVNRRRSVELRDYSFLQVDASIAPGQSGGALLDDDGRLIGLSGIQFGAAAFGLALETDALNERVQTLIDGPPLADPFDATPINSLETELGPHRFIGFMVESDGRIDVEVNSSGDTFIEVLSAAGARKFEDWEGWDYFVDVPRTENDYFRDRTLQGTERLSLAVEPGPYQVLIGSAGSSPAPASITSGSPLFKLPDVEEQALLEPGAVYEGEFGWTKDSDRWKVRLSAGDIANVTIDGIGDFFGVVRFRDSLIASNDDASFGVFGLGSKIEFTAPEDGEYELEIGTRDDDRHGYMVRLDIS